MDNPPPPWPPPVWPPPAPPTAPPTAFIPFAPSAPRGRGWVLLAVVAVLVGAGVVLARRGMTDGPTWAESWDPRVLPLSQFVERERGLPFEHPVRVELVPEAEFVKGVREEAARDSGGSGGSTADGEPDLPFERAFGLVPRSFEQQQSDADATAGIVGAYDPWTRTIRLRGDELTPAVRVTLVHELTHALQDQHFDLRELRRGTETNTASVALLSVIEGDAVAVEQAYLGTLSDAEREQLAAAEADVTDSPELDRVPAALLTGIQMPYVLGPSFVVAVDGLGPAGARDELFRSPPPTDLAVLLPDRHLAGAVRSSPPAEPTLAEGEDGIDSGRFGDDVGAFAWLTVLAARLDVHDAVAAIGGWSGDRYVTFRKGGATCARANLAAADPAGVRALSDAFARWSQAGPAGAASVTTADLTVTVTSCDEGVDDPPADERFDDPLRLLDLRNEAFVADEPLGRADATVAERACLGDAIVSAVTVDELRDLDAVPDERFAEIAARAGAACGFGS